MGRIVEYSAKTNMMILGRTIKCSIAWPLIFSLFLLSISAPAYNYAFLFGSIPSSILCLMYGFDGFSFIIKCSFTSVLVILIPNLVYIVTGCEKRILAIVIAIYFLISSVLGGFLALGMLY